MGKLEFAPIKNRMASVEVAGQVCKPQDGCMKDCDRTVWAGHADSYTEGCGKTTITDAHWSICS